MCAICKTPKRYAHSLFTKQRQFIRIHAKTNSQPKSVNQPMNYRVCAKLHTMFDEFQHQSISE